MTVQTNAVPVRRSGIFALISIISIFVAGAALGRQNDDPRIRYLPYSENSIHKLDMYLKSVTVVQFEKEEQIESILIGDSASWEVIKLKNGHVISIKPTIPSSNTNMTVYTDRRVYTFELRSLMAYSSGGPLQPLRTVFTYPAKKKSVTPSAPEVEIINSNYMVARNSAFRPSWVQDNGKQTQFFLPDSSPRPAIFKVGIDKKEELVNSRTVGNRIVVDGVADYWVLRIGDEFICIARAKAAKSNPNVTVEPNNAR